MKKNIIRFFSFTTIIGFIFTSTIVFASNWTSEVSITTPSWGGTKYNWSVYDSKDTQGVYASIYATYQQTSLRHSAALVYKTATGGSALATSWIVMRVGSIDHPEMAPGLLNLAYYSAAKSNSLEPTNNTIIKFKYSADNL